MVKRNVAFFLIGCLDMDLIPEVILERLDFFSDIHITFLTCIVKSWVCREYRVVIK